MEDVGQASTISEEVHGYCFEGRVSDCYYCGGLSFVVPVFKPTRCELVYGNRIPLLCDICGRNVVDGIVSDCGVGDDWAPIIRFRAFLCEEHSPHGGAPDWVIVRCWDIVKDRYDVIR